MTWASRRLLVTLTSLCLSGTPRVGTPAEPEMSPPRPPVGTPSEAPGGLPGGQASPLAFPEDRRVQDRLVAGADAIVVARLAWLGWPNTDDGQASGGYVLPAQGVLFCGKEWLTGNTACLFPVQFLLERSKPTFLSRSGTLRSDVFSPGACFLLFLRQLPRSPANREVDCLDAAIALALGSLLSPDRSSIIYAPLRGTDGVYQLTPRSYSLAAAAVRRAGIRRRPKAARRCFGFTTALVEGARGQTVIPDRSPKDPAVLDRLVRRSELIVPAVLWWLGGEASAPSSRQQEGAIGPLEQAAAFREDDRPLKGTVASLVGIIPVRLALRSTLGSPSLSFLNPESSSTWTKYLLFLRADRVPHPFRDTPRSLQQCNSFSEAFLLLGLPQADGRGLVYRPVEFPGGIQHYDERTIRTVTGAIRRID